MRKNHLIATITSIFLALLLCCLGGCADTPAPAPRGGFEITPAVWSDWEPGSDYEEYASLYQLFKERTKFTTITVLLDYAEPAAGTLEVAVLKVAAKNPAERWGSILFNPGGPGGDGLVYGLLFNYVWSDDYPNAAQGSGKLFQEITEHYDLVGFSPRGLGASTKLICRSDTDLLPELILSADSSEANLFANRQNAKTIAQACQANPLTRYITSEATARDMDAIRQVLGDDKLNFYGISYGTWLGTWYASLFPERTGQMLLIGQTDITRPLNEALLLQEMGMQRVLEKKLIPYAASNPQLFHLGATGAEVMEAISSLQGPLKHAAIKALDKHISYPENVNSALFTLRSAVVIGRLLAEEAAPEEVSLGQRLDQLDWNVPPEDEEQLLEIAHALADDYFALTARQPQPAELTDSDSVWWAIQCMDTHTPYDADSWALQSTLHAACYPQFGGFYAQNPGLYWSEAPVQRPPIEQIAADAPLLIVQSEFDPYTPLEGALRTFSALPQASIFVIKDDYQHCVMLPYGNDELDQAVAEFFLQQKQPPRLSVIQGRSY